MPTIQSLGQKAVSDTFIENYSHFFPHNTYSIISYVDTIVFIVPDKYNEPGFPKENRYRIDESINSFNFGFRYIIPGKQSDSINYSNYDIIAYGNRENNTWLAKYYDLFPISLFESSFDNLKHILFAWFNPINYKKATFVHYYKNDEYKLSQDILDLGATVNLVADTGRVFLGWFNLDENKIFISKERDKKLHSIEKLDKYPNSRSKKSLSCEELKSEMLMSDFASFNLSDKDINDFFNNINDLSWIKTIADSNNVVLLGENHYFEISAHLRNRIFFTLNTFDYYPWLILEKQYSYTPFVNYFLSLKGKDSLNFYNKYLTHIINDEETLVLLKHVKRWNNISQEKQLSIGYSDIEHNYNSTIEHLLIPYLKSIGMHDIKCNHIENIDELDSIVNTIKQKIDIIKSKNNSFLSNREIDNIIVNLEKTIKAYNLNNSDGFRAFSSIRNPQYIKNILSFKGEKNTKFVVFGGSQHFREPSYTQDSSNVFNYLNYFHEPTKNKVCNIFLSVINYTYKGLDIDANKVNKMGKGYKNLVKDAQQIKDTLGTLDISVSVFSKPYEFIKELNLNGCLNGNKPFLFNQVYWKNRIASYKDLGRKEYRVAQNYYHYYTSFKKTIIIPQSEIINCIE